jgi:HK97 family phage prohead protease
MSALEHDQRADEMREDVIVRELGADLEVGDGRTIEMRIVPFNEVATVADPPDFRPYQEEWMPGVFDKQLRAADKVYLNFQHEPGLKNIIGRGVELRAASDGYHGSFKVKDTEEGDTALWLVREGTLTGASVEVPKRNIRSVRTSTGVVQRVKAHLDAVALCRRGAFTGAVVTAVRDEFILDEELMPQKMSSDIINRCKALGISVPDSLDDTLERAFTDMPWDGSASRWATAAEYCSAAAIDLNPAGAAKQKNMCHLPYKEPGSGTVNLGGVRAALARIGQGYPKEASQSQRDAAKASLERLLAQAKGTN